MNDLQLGLEVLKKYSDLYLASGGTLKQPPRVARIANRKSLLQTSMRTSVSTGAAQAAANAVNQLNTTATLAHTTSFRHNILREKRRTIKKEVLNLLGDSSFPVQMENAQDFSYSFGEFAEEGGNRPDTSAADAAKKAALRVKEKLRESKRKEHEENTVLDALLDARREQLEEIDRLQRLRRVQERRMSNSALGFVSSAGSSRKFSGSNNARKSNSNKSLWKPLNDSSVSMNDVRAIGHGGGHETAAVPVSLNSSLPLLPLV